MSRIARWMHAVAVALLVLLAVAGCGSGKEASADALPDCPGTATADFDLGSIIRDSVPSFPRSGQAAVRTGESSVILQKGTGRQVVTIRVCAPDFGDEELRDTATALGRSVAQGELLGDRVAQLRVDNYSTTQSLISDPFPAAKFRSDLSTAELRGEWKGVTG